MALPLSSLSSGTLPPPPSPGSVLAFPLALGHFIAVIGRAHNQVERRWAVELMLVQRGVAASQASVLAARMYP